MTQPPPPRLMTAIDHAPQSTADQNVDPNSVRQPPSPSAAALEAAKRIFPGQNLYVLFYDRIGEALDAYAAQAVAAERQRWYALSECVAERAKPAASDPERRVAWAIVLDYLSDIGVEEPSEYEDRLGDAIAAVLAERGRVERERAAEIAEHLQELEDVALDIPAAIRNQTTNDEA